MNSLLKLTFVFVICTMLSACNVSDEIVHYIEINESQNSLEYVCTEKKFSRLTDALSKKTTIEALHKTVGIDFIKTRQNGYSTLFLTEKGLVEVQFDSHKNHICTKRIYLNSNISELDMDQITVGDHLSFVRSLDPQGDYSFLYTGQSQTPAISNHYLENGLSYRIYYDEAWCVATIEKGLL